MPAAGSFDDARHTPPSKTLTVLTVVRDPLVAGLPALAQSLADLQQRWGYDVEWAVILDGVHPSTTRHVLADVDITVTTNHGPRHTAAARNIGLRYARGRYITIVDEHDVLDVRATAWALAQLDAHDAAFVATLETEPGGRVIAASPGRWWSTQAPAWTSNQAVVKTAAARDAGGWTTDTCVSDAGDARLWAAITARHDGFYRAGR